MEDDPSSNVEATCGPSSSSPYYFDGGLRKVHPYNHTYLTYAKQRWLGREILEVFSTEFRDRSKDFYAWAISNGTVMVNGRVVDSKYIMRDGDLISNVVHRHEPPIIGGKVEIYHKDTQSGVWVVEKKASMPIHTTGRYRNNTLLEVLKHEHGLHNVSTANRLDRLVSGVILVATSKDAAKRLGADFGTPGRVKKEYVARVAGRFPLGPTGNDGAQVGLEEDEDNSVEGDDVICEAPILTIDKQIGVNVVHPDGRPCRTIFRRLSYDRRSNTSVVRCRPVTGRSHQLRVHLQYLGHPIYNDPIYNNSVAWGKSNAKGGLWQEMERPDVLPQAPSDTLIDSVTEQVARTLLEKPQQPMNSQQAKAYRIAKHNAKQIEISRKARSPLVEDVLGSGSETALGPEAIEAILHLRKARDQEDNFARYRDMDRPPFPISLELPESQESPPCNANGGAGPSNKIFGKMLSKQEREEIALHQAAQMLSKHTSAGEQADPLWYVGQDDKGEYCKACGIPILPDPTPDMLQIWLHAIRYHTDEWDYSSPLPDWARPDWIQPAFLLAGQ